MAALLATATTVDSLTFAIAAAVILAGAIGVVLSRNPVHAALSLVMTLFGVAVLFVEQQANFLAAVQVIVYAGAIVVLFLFVIMFLGVDRRDDVADEPLRGQRPLAFGLVALGLAGILVLGIGAHWSVGQKSVAGSTVNPSGGDVAALGRSVFTTYLWAFEITSALLVIAVVGAVVLARRSGIMRGGEAESTSDGAGTAPGHAGPVGEASGPDAEAGSGAVLSGAGDGAEAEGTAP